MCPTIFLANFESKLPETYIDFVITKYVKKTDANMEKMYFYAISCNRINSIEFSRLSLTVSKSAWNT